jgi:hypothetical protein
MEIELHYLHERDALLVAGREATTTLSHGSKAMTMNDCCNWTGATHSDDQSTCSSQGGHVIKVRLISTAPAMVIHQLWSRGDR